MTQPYQPPAGYALVPVTRLRQAAERLSDMGQKHLSEPLFAVLNGHQSTDPLADQIREYPAYWREIPADWTHLDYYRVRALFPLPPEHASARLDHSMKKLLVPGVRTGGKPFYKDIAEAHTTLGQWLKEHKPCA